MADSEIQNMIQSHVQNMVAEQVMSGETQKTNLEEQNLVGIEQTKHHHKKHHKKHHHEKKPKAQAQVQTALAAKTPVPAVKIAPASKSLLATKGKSGDALEAQS